MEKSALKLQDTLGEIEIDCDKTLAIINNLLAEYDFCEDDEPSIQHLKSSCLNRDDKAGLNAFNFIAGYNEIVTFIRIALDYTHNIKTKVEQALS